VARFPGSGEKQKQVEALLTEAKREGRSYGGRAEIRVRGVPAGLGQPVFHKLKADLAGALMGVGAACSVEIGDGLEAVTAEGSSFHRQSTQSHYGGIRGGISTGEEIVIRVGFKPTSTVLDEARKGRHDPCIVTRAIPVLEAMTALVLADHSLWSRTDRLEN
jgi:chorismate synthase